MPVRVSSSEVALEGEGSDEIRTETVVVQGPQHVAGKDVVAERVPLEARRGADEGIADAVAARLAAPEHDNSKRQAYDTDIVAGDVLERDLDRIIQVELVSQIQVRCERTEGARVDQQRSDSSLARPQEILFIPGGALQLQGHGEVMLVALQPMILGTQQYVAEATGAAPGAVVRR